MSQGRPLRAVFEELLGDDIARQAYAADPSGTLGDAGHGDLPGELVAEAIVSFAGTAPPAVAEHLAPFVTAHSVVPAEDGEPPAASTGLDLLATAPPPDTLEGSSVDDAEPAPDRVEPGADAQPVADAPLRDDLDFGSGAADVARQPEDAAADTPDAAPLPGGDTGPAADMPAEPFPPADMLPGGPEPEPDEAEREDLPE